MKKYVKLITPERPQNYLNPPNEASPKQKQASASLASRRPPEWKDSGPINARSHPCICAP